MDNHNLFKKKFKMSSYFCSCSNGTKCCCGEGPGSGPTCVTALKRLTCFNEACITVWVTLHHHISHGCFLVAPTLFPFCIYGIHGLCFKGLRALGCQSQTRRSYSMGTCVQGVGLGGPEMGAAPSTGLNWWLSITRTVNQRGQHAGRYFPQWL